jgi:hypothetical protein
MVGLVVREVLFVGCRLEEAEFAFDAALFKRFNSWLEANILLS